MLGAMATATAVLLSGRSAAAFVLPSSPPSPPSPPQAAPVRLPTLPAALQLLAISCLGPLASLVASPVPPAMAALDLATVSKLQGQREQREATGFGMGAPRVPRVTAPHSPSLVPNRRRGVQGHQRVQVGRGGEGVDEGDRAGRK